ncbi:MAG: tripartite tricarboxylate transporter substrate binding protein [Pseudolabrys sp.]|jgi:tripartite-type tricarboxylate transporter receptor subunit TctC
MKEFLVRLAGRGFIAAVLGAAVTLLFAHTSMAQSPADKYPDKPIRIIVPFAPGGSVDLVARIIGQKFTEAWHQTAIIETRPGAGTMIGTQALAKADPDGYTLMVAVSNHATNPSLHSTMAYDALKDFEFISMVARAPVVIYSYPKFAPKNLQELIAYAKAKPGTLSFGSAGPGSMTHLVAEQLKIEAGIDMTHVVYRGGTPAMNDAMAGQIPMTFATVSQALQQYHGGLLRALAVTSEKRYPFLAEVPTFKEQGVDLVASEWYVVLAPAKTPKPIVDKLNAEIRRMMAIPKLGDRLPGIELISSTPEEARSFVASEIARWQPVIKKLGLKMD